ncbi:MAG: riboflavin synthase [Pseudomonadota bacterium]
MFTGIIQTVGTIDAVDPHHGDVRLRVHCPDLKPDQFAEGESICVSGVCLTAIDITTESFAADVSRETLDVTTLAKWHAGTRVNLEPSLALGDRLGGHLVTGHTDGVGEMVGKHTDARSIRMTFKAPEALARYIARKGSVCIDGTSLTVNAVRGVEFDVNIIPHTAAVTTLGERVVGDAINLEIDLLARYAERLAGADEDPAPGATLDLAFLREQGYAR